MKKLLFLGTALLCVLMMTLGLNHYSKGNKFNLLTENIEALARGESTGLLGNASLQESTVTEKHTVSRSGTIKVQLRNTAYHKTIELSVSEAPGSTHSYKIKKKECNYCAQGHCEASEESATIVP